MYLFEVTCICVPSYPSASSLRLKYREFPDLHNVAHFQLTHPRIRKIDVPLKTRRNSIRMGIVSINKVCIITNGKSLQSELVVTFFLVMSTFVMRHLF
jgi:hypothetical protein